MRTLLLIAMMALAVQGEPLRPSKKIRLFNGKDLTNFYAVLGTTGLKDPKNVFTVTGGMIHVSGEAFGGLSTVNEYADYHLVMEWKWGGKAWPPRADKARDSGILLHGTGADGAAGNGWMESIEYQMIEGGTGDLLLVKGAAKPAITVEAEVGPDKQLYYKKGAARVKRDTGRVNWWGRDVAWKDVLGVRGPRDVERPVGEWNLSEVIARGGNLEYRLNGKVVNEGFDGTHTGGKIQIQSEGAEVYVRKMELRPLKGR